jgi:IMP dehydrogenase
MDLLNYVRGCTFDDFLLTPQRGVLPRRDPATVDLSARFSRRLTLNRPLVSANMDTVTRAAMAIVLAEEGGLGIVDRGFRAGDIAPQVAEIATVKRTQHGIIGDPHTIGDDQSVEEARRMMVRTRVGTLAVVDAAHHLKGLLTERDVRFVAGDTLVSARMTPRDRLVMHEGQVSLAEAERLMTAKKIKKLPLVRPDGTLLGLPVRDCRAIELPH